MYAVSIADHDVLLFANVRYGDGKMKPTNGSDEQLQYTYWLHFAEGNCVYASVLVNIMVLIFEPPFFV